MINKNKTARIYIATAICLTAFSLLAWNQVSAAASVNINVSLTLYNSYSGSISLVSTGFTTGGITYITSTWLTLDISASDTSSRELFGDISSSVTWNGVWSYTDTINHFVTSSDGPKTVTGMFFKWTEFLIPNQLPLFLDTTSPTIPLGLTPFLNESVSANNIVFNWSPSIDAWVWVKEYYLVISESPTFTSPLVFTSATTTFSIDDDDLPLGTLYWYVEAIDHLGYSSVSFPLYFSHLAPPIEQQGSANAIPGFLPPDYWTEEEEEPLPTDPVELPDEESLRAYIKRFTRAILEPLGPSELPTDTEQPATTPWVQPSRTPGTTGVAKPTWEYTKNPKYPRVFFPPVKKPGKPAKTILEQLEDQDIDGLTPEQVEELKEELAESPSPIQDYLDNVLPHTAAELEVEEVWEQLIEVYKQIPEDPFQSSYLQGITFYSKKIPLVAIVLRLLMICYDIETYRQWTYRLAHYKIHEKKTLKTWQVIPPQV